MQRFSHHPTGMSDLFCPAPTKFTSIKVTIAGMDIVAHVDREFRWDLSQFANAARVSNIHFSVN
jgi:hypothetical protein